MGGGKDGDKRDPDTQLLLRVPIRITLQRLTATFRKRLLSQWAPLLTDMLDLGLDYTDAVLDFLEHAERGHGMEEDMIAQEKMVHSERRKYELLLQHKKNEELDRAQAYKLRWLLLACFRLPPKYRHAGLHLLGAQLAVEQDAATADAEAWVIADGRAGDGYESNDDSSQVCGVYVLLQQSCSLFQR